MERINNARELRRLADALGVGGDWHEPGQQEVDVRIEGENFDNAGHWPESDVRSASVRDGWKGEFCVVITKDGRDVAAVNLASLLAMASYPDGPLR